MAGERVELETFLEGLAEPARGQARAAAGRIDELERDAQAVAGIEKLYMPWALGAAVLFAVGVVIIFSDNAVFRDARQLLGLVPIAGLLASLPAVAIAYGIKVRRRTQADRQAWELNMSHFLPHGGIYFPIGEEGPGVYLTGPLEEKRPERIDEKIRAGRIW